MARKQENLRVSIYPYLVLTYIPVGKVTRIKLSMIQGTVTVDTSVMADRFGATTKHQRLPRYNIALMV
jgi:hypothetical protein